MSTLYAQHIDWIDTQHDEMCQLLHKWASINSGSTNLSGLAQMRSVLKQDFALLSPDVAEYTLDPQKTVDDRGRSVEHELGQALHFRKRPDAPIQVFLGGHMDTVFGTDSPFQTVEHLDSKTWRGPGVTDLKGGLVVMLTALRAFEQSPFADALGWEILINPDEEIGSTGSAPLLEECARRCQVGLVFEPSLPDGTFVSARKGSANLVITARGVPAHAGRAFFEGRNAIVALAKMIEVAQGLTHEDGALTFNVGQVSGGGAVNIVPEFALCRCNIRYEDAATYQATLDALAQAARQLSTDGIELSVQILTHRPPKPFNESTQALFEDIRSCAEQLDQTARWQSTGGVCDGNILSAAGLPTIDTLGVIGGKIHTNDEYIELTSLTARARLTALYLMRLAAGELSIPGGSTYESHRT